MDPLRLIFRSKGFLVFNKPAGLPTRIEGNDCGRYGRELWELAQELIPDGNIAHRIDMNTSGCVIAGESFRHIRYLQRNWHQITTKTYLALIQTPAWRKKVVSDPIDGKSAKTVFSVLEQTGEIAVVQCELVQSGRTHQIRKHLQSIGSPIIGDRRYGGDESRHRDGQMLHAWRLRFDLPDNYGRPGTQSCVVQAEVPSDFKSQAPNINWGRLDKAATNQTLAKWNL
jgi:23S rRNA-/tRNA-specific pseudouridylate synthase